MVPVLRPYPMGKWGLRWEVRVYTGYHMCEVAELLSSRNLDVEDGRQQCDLWLWVSKVSASDPEGALDREGPAN